MSNMPFVADERAAALGQRANDTVLDVAEATFAYGGRPALRGINMSVRAGEVYALLGPNGAGKTTLVRAICGRIALARGRVAVLGFDPRTDRRARVRTGFVPQEVALYSRLTGRENLSVFARLLGVRRGDAATAVTAAMGFTQVGDRADELVANLSGGWRRRFNMAAGILHAPNLLVLDEPSVGVDLGARAAIDEAIARLRGNGLAILVVTHDLDQAEALADRVGIMTDGRIVLTGRPADLLCDRFGPAARHASFVLGRAVDASEELVLAREGLTRSGDGATWTAEAVGDYGAAATIAARLETRGLAVTGLTISKPILADLFARTVERGPQAGRAI